MSSSAEEHWKFIKEARSASTQGHHIYEYAKYTRNIRERRLFSRSTREAGKKAASAISRV